MSKDFFRKTSELAEKGEPFATATVVHTEGSCSAKNGSKAIVQEDGTTLFGWVGGGCVESQVSEAALESLRDGQARTVEVDLESEVAGMPCGGKMKVFVEPHLPKETVVVLGHGPIAETVARLAHQLGFSVAVDDPLATPEKYPGAESLVTDDADFAKAPVDSGSYVVITTQHHADDKALAAVMPKRPRYIALVASKMRSAIVLNDLAEAGVSREELLKVRAPAGLDLGAATPEEIALAIVGEIVTVRRGGSGKPLVEVKGHPLLELRVVEPAGRDA